MQTITTKGLSKKSLFVTLLKGYLFSIGIFAVICGILSLFGFHTVTIQGKVLTGIKGLFGGILLAFILPFIAACVNWVLLGFGIWLWTKFKPIKLEVKS